MALIMMDSLPGIGKIDLIKNMTRLYPTATPFIAKIDDLSGFYEVFAGHQEDRISRAVFSLELLMLGNTLQMINDMQYAMRSCSVIISENSIFWPFVWIETFHDLGYIKDEERNCLFEMLKLVCERFLDFTSSQGYNFVYQYIHVPFEDKYEFVANYTNNRCYHLSGRVFIEHKNFFNIIMKYVPFMFTFIRGLSTYNPERHVFIFEHNNFINPIGGKHIVGYKKPPELAQELLNDLTKLIKDEEKKIYDSYPSTPDIIDFDLLELGE